MIILFENIKCILTTEVIHRWSIFMTIKCTQTSNRFNANFRYEWIHITLLKIYCTRLFFSLSCELSWNENNSISTLTWQKETFYNNPSSVLSFHLTKKSAFYSQLQATIFCNFKNYSLQNCFTAYWKNDIRSF